MRTGNTMRDEKTGEFVILTNLIDGPAGLLPYEGLVFSADPDGTLRSWRMENLQSRTLTEVTPEDSKRVSDWYYVRAEQMGKDIRAGYRSFYVTLSARPGALLLGGVKELKSSRFASRVDAEDFAHAITQQPGAGNWSLHGSRKDPEIRSL